MTKMLIEKKPSEWMLAEDIETTTDEINAASHVLDNLWADAKQAKFIMAAVTDKLNSLISERDKYIRELKKLQNQRDTDDD